MVSRALIIIACLLGLPFAAQFLLQAVFMGNAIALQGQLQSKLNAFDDRLDDFMQEAHLVDHSSIDGKKSQFLTFMNSARMDPRRNVTIELELASNDDLTSIISPQHGIAGIEGESSIATIGRQECELLRRSLADTCIVATAKSTKATAPSGKTVEKVEIKLIFKEKVASGNIDRATRNTFYTEQVTASANAGSIASLIKGRILAYDDIVDKCAELRRQSNCSVLAIRIRSKIDKVGRYWTEIRSEVGQIKAM